VKRDAEEVKRAYEQLRELCPQGSTVYCVLRGVSRSGMSRNIDFYAIITDDKKPRLQWLTGYMSAIGVVKQSRGDWEKSRGAKVHGCGMDMGFHVVDTLASALYGRNPNGIGKGLRHEWI
jgi:hypothetical protein